MGKLINILSILIGLICFPTFSQNVELSVGSNTNHFHDYCDNDGHYLSSYTPGGGHSIAIATDRVKLDWMTLRLSLKFDNYSGELEARNGGLGGSSTTKASIEKSLITLGIFPINHQLFNLVDLNIGFELSKLISESNSGTIKGSNINNQFWNYDLNERHPKYNAPIAFGLSSRLAYYIKVNDSFSIVPQYSFYYGLTNEFIQFPKTTKSIRHLMGVGLNVKLQNNNRDKL